MRILTRESQCVCRSANRRLNIPNTVHPLLGLRLFLIKALNPLFFCSFKGPGFDSALPDGQSLVPLRVHGGSHAGRLPHLHQPGHLLLDEQTCQIRLHGHCG